MYRHCRVLTDIRRGSRAIQNSNFSTPSPCGLNYQIIRQIPITVFRPDYPQKIDSFGDLIRKTRIDLGLQIKDLAKILKVEEDTVINWEYRRKQPSKRHLRSIVKFLRPMINDSIQKKDFWQLCFENDKLYPQTQDAFGERLRVTRMQNLLSIRELAQELKVDPTTVAKWERMENQPIPGYNSHSTPMPGKYREFPI